MVVVGGRSHQHHPVAVFLAARVKTHDHAIPLEDLLIERLTIKKTKRKLRQKGLHILMDCWSEFFKVHLQRERSFLLQVGDPLSLKGPKPGPLDQPVQDEHPLLPISQRSDL